MPRTTRNRRPKKNAGQTTKKRTNRQQSLVTALADLTIATPAVFGDCQNADDEFRAVRKAYHQQCLRHHPDKGGDAAVFRRIHASFRLLKDAKEKWLFSEILAGQEEEEDEEEESFDADRYYADFDTAFGDHVPSWEFYQQAAEEAMPSYRVELAKSGRSKCTAKGKAQKCSEKFPTATKATATELGSTDLVEQQQQQAPAVEYIDKEEIRIGWVNEQSGTYGRWVHLRCWRVPIKVWMGLPQDPKATTQQFAAALQQMDEDLLTGFAELLEPDQDAFVEYCRNKDHWAVARTKKQIAMVEAALGKGKGKVQHPKPKKATKKKTKKALPVDEAEPGTTEDAQENLDVQPDAQASSTATAMVVVPSNKPTSELSRKLKFVVPQPGINGASDATVFEGKTFVLTGVFPEVGGGAGLTLGKDRVKQMIRAFGGRVTGSISGKTNVLVVGASPGYSKVSKARGRGKACQMASLHDLKVGLDRGLKALEDFEFSQREEPLKIDSFSKGYQYANPAIGYNGLAQKASKMELAIAQGLVKVEEPNEDVEVDSTTKGDKEEAALLALPDGNKDSKPHAKKKKKPAKNKKAAVPKKVAKKRGRKVLKDVAANQSNQDGNAEAAPARKKARSRAAAKE